MIGSFAQNPIGITYHNVTARYNAYFIANERIKEIEQQIEERYQWNYNRVLPIFPQYDTTTSASLKEQLEDCVVKASIAIQRHPESRWEDNAYILVGKARMFGSEFPDAIETFKWVNTHGDDANDQHRALIYLLRTFIEAGEMRNALAVSDYLKKKDLHEENQKDFYLYNAYYHQVNGDFNQMVGQLVKAEAMMANSDEKARIDFIIGQVYQELGFEANAYDYYKRALKGSNTYELSFYTKLNMAQVTELNKSNNVRKVQKYFKKLLKDPKNLEYQDRIYYEMGEFDLKRGELTAAINNYKESVSKSSNPKQKSYAYLKLAEIYYDSLRSYSLAKSYYDSTIQVFPKEEPGFEQHKKRQGVLAEFVKYYNQLQTNDSLLNVSTLSESEIQKLVDQELARLEEEDKAEKERRKKEKRKNALAGNNTYNETNQVTIRQDFQGTWYFYNTSEISVGLAEFKRKWGERPLEDDWRRKNKVSTNEQTTPNEEIISTSPEQNEEDDAFDRDAIRKEILASLPTSEEELVELRNGVETAYYQLGNIYNFKLEEKQNAIASFENLLRRFPDSEYIPEVLYQLYLLYKPLDENVSKGYSDKLIEEHPESVYAKLLYNPNYREEQKALNNAYRIAYEKAYNLYDEGYYEESLRMIDSVLSDSPENDYIDNLVLLRAMNFGETEGVYKYQFELNNFLKRFPDSEVAPHAQLLVKASEDFQINLYSSSRAKFIQNFDTSHYFLIVYLQKPELGTKISRTVEGFLESQNADYRTGNLVLDQNQSLILVSEFQSKEIATNFIDKFRSSVKLDDLYKGERLYPLVITVENFGILYESKDLDSYLNFYQKNYP